MKIIKWGLLVFFILVFTTILVDSAEKIPRKLRDLVGENLANPNHGEVVVWDNTLQKWVSGAMGAPADNSITNIKINSAANISGSKLADDSITNDKFSFDHSTYNFRYGTLALASLTTGAHNNAFGLYALRYNGEGNFNNAFGNEVLMNNTSGNKNTGFGDSVLYSNTQGIENHGFGDTALYSNITGSHNSAFGGGPLKNNVDGSYNNAFGRETLFYNTSSSGSAFGDLALTFNTTGEHNSAFGAGAGTGTEYVYTSDNANTTGSFNTWVGAHSGPVDNTQRNNSSAFGYLAKNTADNQVSLGNSSVTDFLFGGQSLSRTELSYLNNGTGNIQEQLDAKAPKAVTILDNVSGPSAAQSYGSLNRITGAITVLLPTAVAGMSTCVMDSGTAHDIIVDVQGGDTMTLNGTEQAAGVGITNASGSSTGDLVCVIAHAANKWSTASKQGTWASQ